MSTSMTLLFVVINDNKDLVGDFTATGIRVASNASLRQLRDQVFSAAKNNTRVRGVRSSQLSLYRMLLPTPKRVTRSEETDMVASPNSKTEIGALLGKLEILDPGKLVSEYWTEEPEISDYHLVVHVPSFPIEEPNESPCQIWKNPYLKESLQEIKRLSEINDLEQDSFSESAFRNAAKDILIYNRPFWSDTIPISLLQEEYGRFQDDCELLPSSKAYELLQGLTLVACDQHDGVTILPPVILSSKGDHGLGLVGAITYYVQFLCIAIADMKEPTTRFPCILIVNTGTCFEFFGCLWDGVHVHVEPLTHPYDLMIHSTNEAGRRSAAAGLDALM